MQARTSERMKTSPNVICLGLSGGIYKDSNLLDHFLHAGVVSSI